MALSTFSAMLLGATVSFVLCPVTFVIERSCFPEDFMKSEVDRYLGLPGQVVRAVDGGFQAAIAEVREAGLNIMMSMHGDGKPVSFIEDCAVDLADLADYTERLNDVFEKYNTKGTWYAHASVGCLHVRPVLSMKDPADVAKTRGRVWVSAGHEYHSGLTGHIRLNIATSADRLTEIVRRLAGALTTGWSAQWTAPHPELSMTVKLSGAADAGSGAGSCALPAMGPMSSRPGMGRHANPAGAKAHETRLTGIPLSSSGGRHPQTGGATPPAIFSSMIS